MTTHPTAPRKPRSSLWAIGLLCLSSGFALLSIVLFSQAYGLL